MTSPLTESTLPQLLGSARLCAFRLDIDSDMLELIQVDRPFYRHATFLDQRSLGGRQYQGIRVRFSEITGRLDGQPARPSRWIFHMGHCGSTLISRCLDGLPDVLGLREPQPLLALAAYASERGTPLARCSEQMFTQWALQVKKLLSRPYDGDSKPVVKASSVATCLVSHLLGEEDRAIFLTLPLVNYLAILLRDPGLRVGARQMVVPRLATYLERAGDDGIRLYALTDAEIIALTWLVDMDAGMRINAGKPPGHIGRIDFETWLQDPARGLATVASTLDLRFDDEQIQTALAQAQLGRYAKDQTQVFNSATRKHELSDARTRYAREIAEGQSFVMKLITRHPGVFAIVEAAVFPGDQ